MIVATGDQTMNQRNLTNFVVGLSVFAFFSVGLVGCGKKNAESLVVAAKESLAKKDYANASLQLKNALQQRDDAEVRFLLSKTLVEQGDFVAAELQLRRAIESGYSMQAIYPLLARVLAGRGEHTKLIAELGAAQVADPAARVLVKTILGEAYLAVGKAENARNAFAAALSDLPNDPRARVGEAKVLAMAGDFDGAGRIADEILKTSRDLPQALTLKADLLVAQSKPDEAVVLLDELVKLLPSDGQPRFALISLLIASEKLDRAAAEIDAMKKAAPRDIRSRYLEAVLAFRKGDSAKARDAAQQVLSAVPNHAPSLLLAGAAEYQLGSLSTAEDHLKKVLSAQPTSLYARNLLIATYLRKGQPRKADDVLQPALKQAPSDPAILRSAGEVAFANNQIADAAGFYERAIAIEKDNSSLRTRLAQIRLASGDTGRALDDLEKVAGMDSGQYQADLSLISAYLGRKEYDKALAAIAVLEKKQPNNPLTHAARGTVYAAKNDTKSARMHLEKAVTLQPSYLPAARILAGLDIAEKNPAAARKRFDAMLANDPKDEGALLSLADVLIATGGTAPEITATIERAIKGNPASSPARIALVKYLSQSGNAKGALTAAQAAVAAIPNEPRILDVLGLAQLAAGETSQAIETFNKLSSLQPDSPLPLMRLASAQYAAKQVDEPIRALRKALAMKPDLIEAQRQIVVAQLAAGRVDDALKEVKAIQKSRPKEAVGFAMEGDVLASQKKHAEAAIAYAEGSKRQGDPELVVKQIQMLQTAGKSADAGLVSQKWLKENPKDPVVRFHLANVAMQNKEYKYAAERYRELLTIRPDVPAVLNNLAWVLNELADPSAISYAEKANSISPGNADIQDTLGWLLVARGDAKRGVELLKQSVAASPKSPEPRMHLAKGLIKIGDKAGAKRALEELIVIPGAGALKDEAEQLLKSL